LVATSFPRVPLGGGRRRGRPRENGKRERGCRVLKFNGTRYDELYVGEGGGCGYAVSRRRIGTRAAPVDDVRSAAHTHANAKAAQ
ncbi:hypothetical protein ALC62_11536, partial [Cyphomyrmex costatus]